MGGKLMLKEKTMERTHELDTLDVTRVVTGDLRAANGVRAETAARRMRRQRRANAGHYRSGNGWSVGLW